MANSSEEQKKETKPIKQNQPIAPEKQAARKKNTTQSRSNAVLSGLSVFIAIAAVIIAVWSIQNNYTLQKKLSEKQTNLITEIEQIKQKQADNEKQIDTEIDTKTNNFKQSQSELQSKLEDLTKQLQIAMNQKLYQNQDWLLLKARYYLELAQINAHWSDNYSAAISLLQQADKLLGQLSSPKVFTVRQAIAKEIAQLKAIPNIDIAGLLSQLDAAQASVSNLTLQTVVDQKKSDEDSAVKNESTKNANRSAWQIRLQDSVNLLEKMVVVRRDNEHITPLMSPLYESVLKESIRLNLQEAQWAILNNNPEVYQLALKQAILNLTRTFNKASPNTAALLKQLNDLQQVKIAQEKPVTEQALPLLNQIIDNQELLIKPTNNGDKGEN